MFRQPFLLLSLLAAVSLLGAESLQVRNDSDQAWTLCPLLANGQEEPQRQILIEPHRALALELQAGDPVFFTLRDHLGEQDSRFRVRQKPAAAAGVELEAATLLSVRGLPAPFRWEEGDRTLAITGEQCRTHLLRKAEALNVKRRRREAEEEQRRNPGPGPASGAKRCLFADQDSPSPESPAS